MEKFTKVFEIAAKDASVGENTITGAASVMGVMDRSWAKDVMCPGCWSGALEGFKSNGFVPSGHNWSDYDKLVAMPMVAEERGNQLYTEAEFHSTEFAQTVRTICQERLGKGLSVGLSVGFSIADDGCLWFPNGKELMAWAMGRGMDTSKFDPRIAEYEDECRAIHQVAELYEYSIVTVPANPHATAHDVKSFPIGGCVTLADRISAVCAAAGQVQAELQRVSDLRSADGRSLSPERLAQAKELADQLLQLAATATPDEGKAHDTAADRGLQLDAEAFLLTA